MIKTTLETRDIFNFAISESYETGTNYGIRNGDVLVGHAALSSDSEEEYVEGIVGFAERWHDDVKDLLERLIEIEEEEASVNDDKEDNYDHTNEEVYNETEIEILSRMMSWTYNKDELIELAREDWREIQDGDDD